MQKKNKYKFKTKTVKGESYIQCRASQVEDKYYLYKPCENWVKQNKNIVAVLCYQCVNKLTSN